MFNAFLIKYGEIGIKGKNRYLFEDALIKQIKYALRDADGIFEVTKEQGRIFVFASGEFDYEETITCLRKVFGIVGICPVVVIEDRGFEDLTAEVIKYVDMVYPDKNKTFKVNARRARKNYPLDSIQINMELGGKLLEAFKELKVDVHKPEIFLTVEVRSKIYLY